MSQSLKYTAGVLLASQLTGCGFTTPLDNYMHDRQAERNLIVLQERAKHEQKQIELAEIQRTQEAEANSAALKEEYYDLQDRYFAELEQYDATGIKTVEKEAYFDNFAARIENMRNTLWSNTETAHTADATSTTQTATVSNDSELSVSTSTHQIGGRIPIPSPEVAPQSSQAIRTATMGGQALITEQLSQYPERDIICSKQTIISMADQFERKDMTAQVLKTLPSAQGGLTFSQTLTDNKTGSDTIKLTADLNTQASPAFKAYTLTEVSVSTNNEVLTESQFEKALGNVAEKKFNACMS